MAEQPDRQRLRPTREGRAHLLAAIEMVGQPHVVDTGRLGEYAELVAVHGEAYADATFPEVAEHLDSGCLRCADDVDELVALTSEPDIPRTSEPDVPRTPARARGRDGRTPSPSPTPSEQEQREGVLAPLVPDDSGIYAIDLPDVRAAEAEAARRQKLRRVRDWLLVAAAVSILLIGLSLVGMAYLASSQPGARVGLTPLPVTAPAAGRAAPSDTNCPASHPIKGNRASRIYHLPGGGFYEQTHPEDCFASPADAEAAGYRRSQR